MAADKRGGLILFRARPRSSASHYLKSEQLRLHSFLTIYSSWLSCAPAWTRLIAPGAMRSAPALYPVCGRSAADVRARGQPASLPKPTDTAPFPSALPPPACSPYPKNDSFFLTLFR